MENEVAKALHDGLDTLRERGWTQWELCDRTTGRVCVRGALTNAQAGDRFHPNQTQDRADDLLTAVAVEQYPDRLAHDPTLDYLPAFNNHPDTTQEDVERIFEKAIVRAYETL